MAPKRKMCDEWLEDPEFQPWLCKDAENPHQAFCNMCNKWFQAEISTIKRHKVNNIYLLYKCSY